MSGRDPIDRGRLGTEEALMTLLLAPRTDRTTAPRGRCGREDSLDELRDRIERSAYEVDPEQVAEAIVARLERG